MAIWDKLFSQRTGSPRGSASLVPSVGKGVNVPSAMASIASWLWGNTGVVREPYTGAWQEGSGQDAAAPGRTSALSNSAVFASIKVISSDIAKLPLRIMRKVPTGGREIHRKSPYFRLCRRPNRHQTSIQFFQQWLSSKLYSGNAYILLKRDNRGVVNEMFVLDPRTVEPMVTREGDVWYRVQEDSFSRVGEPVYIPAMDILHDREVCLFHPLVGVSPLFAAGVSALMGNSIANNSQTFFQNMSRASGTLTAPSEIPPATADRLKREWDNNYSGLGFGKVAVLGSGLEWKPLTINADDAQLIEQLRWTVEDIARVYRLPGFMIGELAKTNYRNSEQLARTYYNGCLSYYIIGIQQALHKALDLDDETEAEFDLRPLFAMETDVRYEAHKKALQSGIKSINEVRDEEDLPPVDGGEEPRVQAQYVPLSLATGEGVNIPGQEVPSEDNPDEEDPEDDTDEPDDDPGDDDSTDDRAAPVGVTTREGADRARASLRKFLTEIQTTEANR